MGGNFFGCQIKTLSGNRDRHRAEQDDSTGVQLTAQGGLINAANAPAVAIVHAVVDPQRLSDDKVTADHVDVCSGQRRIAQAHRQACGDIQLNGPRPV